MLSLLKGLLKRQPEETKLLPVGDDEEVERFLFDKSEFSVAKGVVKPPAFFPPKNGKFSVFRHTKMSAESIGYARLSVGEKRNKKYKASACLSVSDIKGKGLNVNPEETDYRWHADIEGWPAFSSKDEMKMFAIEMVKIARLEK